MFYDMVLLQHKELYSLLVKACWHFKVKFPDPPITHESWTYKKNNWSKKTSWDFSKTNSD